jgi:predicted aconitase with swiveling domain
VGSYVIYPLKKRGLAPVAMINICSEPIVAVVDIISGIPLVRQSDGGDFAGIEWNGGGG